MALSDLTVLHLMTLQPQLQSQKHGGVVKELWG